MAACGGKLDAGWDEPKGMLPVDDRNPIVLCNDGYYDNWQGEYAMLLSSTGGPRLAGIVISDSWPWPELDENMAGWRQMVDAAREGGPVWLVTEVTGSVGTARLWEMLLDPTTFSSD
jgi:hypothetical protein